MQRAAFLASTVSVCALQACVPGSVAGVPALGTAADAPVVLPASPFPAELRRWNGGTPPDGWMICNGQTLPISAYPAVYEALGPSSGTGDGTTFTLPALNARRVIALRGKSWA